MNSTESKGVIMKISSVGKKVGIAAGVAAGVGITALAYAKGKQSDAFVKAAENVKNNVEGAKKLNVIKTLGEGFKSIGSSALKAIKEIPSKVSGLFKKSEQAAADTAANVAEKVEA